MHGCTVTGTPAATTREGQKWVRRVAMPLGPCTSKRRAPVPRQLAKRRDDAILDAHLPPFWLLYLITDRTDSGPTWWFAWQAPGSQVFQHHEEDGGTSNKRTKVSSHLPIWTLALPTIIRASRTSALSNGISTANRVCPASRAITSELVVASNKHGFLNNKRLLSFSLFAFAFFSL